MNRTKPTGARRPCKAPLPPAEGEIAALDHACKPSTIRSQRARAARRVGILAQAPVPISREVVGLLIAAGLLAHEDRCHRPAIVKAAQEYWRLHFGL